MSGAAISVRGVSKKFRLFESAGQRLREALHPFRKQYHREFWALRDVAFEVPGGSCFGILGRNGSGKSTLLKIIAGVMQASNGEAAVVGRIAALLELGAGFNVDLTGRQNALLQLQIAGTPSEELERRLGEVERFADIGDFFDQPVRIYSSGMFLRVAFASALSVDPDVLIVDEALAVGDARFQERCLRRLRQLQQAGVTVLVVSHSRDLILSLCQRCIVLDGGALVYDGAPRAAIDVYDRLLFSRASAPADRNEAADDGNAKTAMPAAVIDAADRCSDKPNYNSHEERMGDGRARIIDFTLIEGGRENPTLLPAPAEIELRMRVVFHSYVEAPVFGFRLMTAGGVTLHATDTERHRMSLPSAQAGEVHECRFRFHSPLAAGSYFINLGCTEERDGAAQFLDVRRSMIVFEVANTPHCAGLIEADCQINYARVGVVDR